MIAVVVSAFGAMVTAAVCASEAQIELLTTRIKATRARRQELVVLCMFWT